MNLLTFPFSKPRLGFLLACTLASPVFADSILFSTGDPDGKIATASRPSGNGKIEIETADDFILTAPATTLTGATFTGLLTSGADLASVSEVRIEIYRVFPNDSDVGRTSGAPDFSTPQVPTRLNSPSDVVLTDRDSAAGSLTFTGTILADSFTANNSVLNGINPKPNQQTGGEGPITGTEAQFGVTFTTPIDLPAGHYFFIPQVLLNSANEEFFWLSAPKPIVPPGTPFSPDLQSWIRNENLAPDWLRIGTDIVGPPPTGGSAPTYNAAFSLTGTLPDGGSTAGLCGLGLFGLMAIRSVRRC